MSGDYRMLGLTHGRNIVVYCQNQLRASHSYFFLRLQGCEQVRSYDGAWTEWENDPDTAAATGLE